MEIARLKELFSIDSRALSIFRIFIAIILFFDLFVRSFSLTAHYTDSGTLPLSFYFERYIDTGWISIHLFNGSFVYQSLLFGISFIFAISLLLGYRTKISAVMSWFLLISLHSRNPTVLQGGDIMLRLLLFWAMFLPLNLRYSLDSKFGKTKNDKKIYSFGTAGILLQVAFVYFFSALLKTGEDWYPDGTAVYYALQLDQFATYIGKFLLNFPDLLFGMTYFVYFLEMIGPILLFSPIFFKQFRLVSSFSFFAVLIGMALCMRLGHFPFIGIAAFILFLPGFFFDYLSNKIKFLRVDSKYEIIETKRDNSYYRAINLIALFFIIFIFLWNIQTLGKYNSVPDGLEFIAHKTRVDQYWNMFSPYPLKEDGWYIIEGGLANGQTLDLMTGKEVTYDKPEHVASMYKGERWRKYLMNSWDKSYSPHRPYYLRYLCFDWNRGNENKMDYIKMEFMLEVTGPNYNILPVEKVLLEEIDC